MVYLVTLDFVLNHLPETALGGTVPGGVHCWKRGRFRTDRWSRKWTHLPPQSPWAEADKMSPDWHVLACVAEDFPRLGGNSTVHSKGHCHYVIVLGFCE